MKRECKFIFLFFMILVLTLSLVSAGNLNVTKDHPFLLDGKWVSASQLKAGDIFQTSDGKKIRISSIENVKKNVSVYNLESKDYHNFIVGDNLVVHNSNALNDLEWKIVEGKLRNEYLEAFGPINKNKGSSIPILREGKAGRLEGAIYEPFIQENKKAIQTLADRIDNPNLIIATERGGALIAELVAENSVSRTPVLKIPKVDSNNAVLTSSIQSDLLKKEITDLINSYPDNQPLTIVTTESVVSGSSAAYLAKNLLPYAKDRVKIKLLVHQQTLGKTESQLNDAINKIKSITDSNPNFEIVIARSKFILGEDVNLNSLEPLRIFKVQENSDYSRRIVEERQIPGEKTYRDKLIELLTKD